MRDWKLPGSFALLRDALQQRHGAMAGARQYIRVLQLLAEHPLARVQQAVEACSGLAQAQAERIAGMVVRLAERDAGLPVSVGTATPEIQVPRPDLGRFDQLLEDGGQADGQ